MKRTLFDYSIFVFKIIHKSQIRDNSLYLKNRIYSILFSIILVISFTSINATNYYVSNSGNDSNSGTSESTPWKTISKVNATTFRAGDQILFKKGDTWREQLTISTGGSSGSYITYGSYGSGNKPRILGSEIETTWTRVSGNIWQSSHTFTDPYAINRYYGNIFFVGTNENVSWGRVRKTSTSACVTEYDWTWANSRIYIYSPTDPNTRYSGVEISQRFRGVALNAKPYIIFDNLEIAYASGYGIHDNIEANISGLIVRNCHIHHLNIKGNLGYGVSVARSNTLFQNNEIHNCGRRAISLHAYGANGFTYENHIAEYNIFYDCFHTTGVDIGVATTDNTHWKNITIRYNYFYHNPMPHAIDGVEVIGSGFMYCGQEGAGSIDNVFIHNNIYKNTISRAYDIGNINGPTNMNIWNNVFYGVDPNITTRSTYFILIQDKSNVNFRNNIFYNDANINHTTNFSVMGIASDAGKITLNNNLYYNTSAQRLMIWYGTSYTASQWETYKSVSGQDAHSILGKNPLFVSSTDFHLQQNSPAIDAGVDVGLTYDFEKHTINNAPDIGVDEWQSKTTETLTKYTTENISICEGSSYQGWPTSGQYKRILKAVSGADSIVTTNLTVNPVYQVSEDISINEGESYQGWFNSGQYQRTLTSAAGCDSVVTTNLTVVNVSPTFSEYRFEEASGTTVIDSKGSNNGTIINQGIRGAGIAGKGLEFIGSGYINLGKSFGDVKNAVTVSAWVNPGATTGDYQGIVWHGGPNYETFTLYILPNVKEIGFSTFGTTPSWFSVNANNLFDGNWHHLAATFNAPEKVIYLDGVAIARLNVTGTIESGQDYDLLIGSSIVSGAQKYLYDGLIDEVRIYNYTLTLSEISALFNAVKTPEVKYTTENIAVCEGSSYEGWTTSGQYERVLTAASGTDSIVTTNLTVNPVYHVSEDITIFEGESYQGWYESGQYERTLTASTGCDSIVTTNLVVENISPTFSEYRFEEAHGTVVIDSNDSNDGTIIDEVIRGVGIVGKGLKFTGSGYINLGQSFGDNVSNAVTVSAWINPGATTGDYQALIWHGGPAYETFTLYILPDAKEIGFSTFGTTPSWFSADANNLFDGNWHHLVATFNSPEKIIYLDGVAIANFNVAGTIESGQGYDLLIGSSIVSGSPTYLYDGLIDEVKIYNYALTSSEIDDLYNAVKTSQVKYKTEDISICEGSSYEGWTTSGQYERILTAASGADSIVTTNLTVNPGYSGTEDITIFEGESYLGWSESGQYERTLTASTGCDSIVTTNLTKEFTKNTIENISICEGSSYEGWTTSGQYERILTAASGADSIATTNLTVNPVYSVTTEAAICEGETYSFGSQMLSEAGEYTEVFETVYGCDSIVILTLTLKEKYYITENIIITEGEDYNGWSEEGIYQRNLISSAGCDSVVVTYLSIEQVIVEQKSIHTIKLGKGWNIISSYLIPSDSNMESVKESLRNDGNLVKVQDESNNTYEQKNRNFEWVNNIGDFQKTEGYRIQVNSECAFEISGQQIQLPLSIPLHGDWNIISFPVNGTVNAMQVIQPLIDAGVLYKVQDEKGNSIENWRNRGWINGIGNFEAGKGYIVQVSSNAILTINESFTKSAQVLAENPTPTYFKVNYDGNGIDHMNINIVELANSQLSVGDELAVFDNNVCVGAVKLTEQHFGLDAVSIPASASEDGLINGYSEGNPIKLKVWRMDTNEANNLSAQTIEGEMGYNRHASVFVALSDLTINVNESLELGVSVDVYPNPASQHVNVRFSSSPDFGTSIALLDISGRKVLSQEIHSDNVVIRLESLQSGTYFVKIPVNSGYLTRKLVKR